MSGKKVGLVAAAPAKSKPHFQIQSCNMGPCRLAFSCCRFKCTHLHHRGLSLGEGMNVTLLLAPIMQDAAVAILASLH